MRIIASAGRIRAMGSVALVTNRRTKDRSSHEHQVRQVDPPHGGRGDD